MRAANCSKIKDLQKRLQCLTKRYKELTEQLAQEREVGIISDELGNLPQIFAEREFVQKQIEIIKQRLKIRRRLVYKVQNGLMNKVSLGSFVRLQNSTHNLEIYLVSCEEANPTQGHISENSPIGRAIIGRSQGEKVIVNIPNGKVRYVIEEIR